MIGFSGGMDMYKLIVAEDEPLLRSGIVHFIRKSDPEIEVVGDAEDGEAACRLARDTNPDIILTDIHMPKLNGLDFIEKVCQIRPSSKVIIVSGYADFQYAQKAIQLKVQDYLLKPVSPEDITAILQKVKAELKRQKNLMARLENMNDSLKQSIPMLTEKFFRNLVREDMPPDEILQKARSLKLDMSGNCFTAVRIKLLAGRTPDDRALNEDAVRHHIGQFCASLPAGREHGYGFVLSDQQIGLILCASNADKQAAGRAAVQNATAVVKSLGESLGVSACAAVGRTYGELRQVGLSFQEASERLCIAFSKERHVAGYDETLPAPDAAFAKPEELEEKLMVEVKLGDWNKSLFIVEKLFHFFTARRYPDASIANELTELAIILERELEKTEVRLFRDERENRTVPYESIHGCREREEMKQRYADFVRTCAELVHKKKAPHGETLIERAIHMMEICLGSEEFSLDDVSSKLFISPNYLRQLFKRQTGESFVEYLTHLRMEKAAQLLQDPTLKIQDIAEKVGYTNQRYFAMCFKKYFYYTPTVFRKIQSEQRNII